MHPSPPDRDRADEVLAFAERGSEASVFSDRNAAHSTPVVRLVRSLLDEG